MIFLLATINCVKKCCNLGVFQPRLISVSFLKIYLFTFPVNKSQNSFFQNLYLHFLYFANKGKNFCSFRKI